MKCFVSDHIKEISSILFVSVFLIGSLIERGCNAQGYLTNQRSTFNLFSSYLAIDNDTTTCSKTGWDVGAWWKLDLGWSRVVSGVEFIGSLDAFQIRGNYSDDLGLMEGFEANALCSFSLAVNTLQAGQTFPCRHPLTGRYVSIKIVDPIIYGQVNLCDVNVQFM